MNTIHPLSTSRSYYINYTPGYSHVLNGNQSNNSFSYDWIPTTGISNLLSPNCPWASLHNNAVKQLRLLISNVHLGYLHYEDSIGKLQQQRHLMGLLKELLFLVPHTSKFYFNDILNLFDAYALSVNFSPYKAFNAWSWLAQYGSNLLSYPWRPEFKKIKMYSGFYKCNLENSLPECKRILLCFGYREVEGNCLLLEGPIDPDIVQLASLDCLAAAVECKIMIEIFDAVHPLLVTWADILCYRKDHIGSSQQAIKEIASQATFLSHVPSGTLKATNHCKKVSTDKLVDLEETDEYNKYDTQTLQNINESKYLIKLNGDNEMTEKKPMKIHKSNNEIISTFSQKWFEKLQQDNSFRKTEAVLKKMSSSLKSAFTKTDTDMGKQGMLLKQKEIDSWECTACTYNNDGNSVICDMCSKSRCPGPEQKPLTAGGKECPCCTFVNNKYNRICDVCATDLADSPTYV